MMSKLLIASAALLLAGATGAVAENNADLLQPATFGAVTGDAEKDTLAYDIKAPSDLWVRFSDECIVQGATLASAAPAEGLPAATTRNPHAR